jgi:hypothetical protein
MCRSIKVLRGQEDVTVDDIEAAALQYVRKIAGMRKPSRRNEDAFNDAVQEITRASERLLEAVQAGAAFQPQVPAISFAPGRVQN